MSSVSFTSTKIAQKKQKEIHASAIEAKNSIFASESTKPTL